MKYSIDMLEKKVTNGEAVRSKKQNWHGGTGECVIYTSIVSSSLTEEHGIIIMEKGASIGNHFHFESSEDYYVLNGIIECNGNVYHAGDTIEYKNGMSHDCINLADGETQLKFVKKYE